LSGRRIARVALLALASQGDVGAIGEWLPRLEDPRHSRREAAVAELRRAVNAEELDALLEALGRWPATPALHLRTLIVELPLLRAELLRACFRPERAALARELLVEAFEARAEAQGPFGPELDTVSDPRLPWADHGIWVERTGAPRAPLSWFEVRDALACAGVWSQPIVLFPGVGDEPLEAPRVAQAPVEAWLEIELSRRGVVPLRRAVATWLVPGALAAREEPASGAGRPGGELRRRVEGEARLLREALAVLAGRPISEQGRLGADLLAQLGMACSPAVAPADEFSRGVAAARDRPAGRTGTGEPEAAAAEPADAGADLRERVIACIERIESGSMPIAAARGELRDLIDGGADRLGREPLLGGELAELLRRRAAAHAADAGLRTLLEQAARELWLLGRASRPGTRLIDLPGGSAGR